MEHGVTYTDNWPYPLPSGSHMQESVNAYLLERGNPYLFHEEGSPYLGLPLHKQKILARIQRGKHKLGKRKAERVGKASREDYLKLAQACVNAYVAAWQDNNTRLDRITILLKLPIYFRKFVKPDFPRVMIMAYKDWWVYVTIKADMLVNFLHRHGHFPYEAKTFRKELWAILQEQERLEWYYRYAAPISILEAHLDIVDEAKQGKILPRKDKGRKTSKYRKRKEKGNEASVVK